MPSAIKAGLPEGLEAPGQGEAAGWQDRMHCTFYPLSAHSQPMSLWLCTERGIKTTCFYWKPKPTVKWLLKWILTYHPLKNGENKRSKRIRLSQLPSHTFLRSILLEHCVLNRNRHEYETDCFLRDTEDSPGYHSQAKQRLFTSTVMRTQR